MQIQASPVLAIVRSRGCRLTLSAQAQPRLRGTYAGGTLGVGVGGGRRVAKVESVMRILGSAEDVFHLLASKRLVKRLRTDIEAPCRTWS